MIKENMQTVFTTVLSKRIAMCKVWKRNLGFFSGDKENSSEILE